MHTDSIRKFTEIYFNGLKNESYYKPRFETVFTGPRGPGGTDITVFNVHQITDVINDAWEIKSDMLFLSWNSSLYLLADLTTNYEETIEFQEHNQPCVYFGSSEEITIKYSRKKDSESSLGRTEERTIPKSKWQLIELMLEVTSLPSGSESEQFRQALVGHKFPLDISVLRITAPYKTSEGIYKLPVKDVIPVLEAADKKEAATFWQKQGEHLSFKRGCFKLL